MTKWLEWHERIQELSAFVDQTEEHEECQLPLYQKAMEPPHACNLNFKMAQYPIKKRVEFNVLARDHGALDF